MEKKLKHLEMIQAVVARMAGNLFFLKGWSVTLIAALFALAEKDANPIYLLIAFVALVIFWILDGYFLSQERQFRALYDSVRKLEEHQVDFSMDTRPFRTGNRTWWRSIFSQTLTIFYGILVGTVLLVGLITYKHQIDQFILKEWQEKCSSVSILNKTTPVQP